MDTAEERNLMAALKLAEVSAEAGGVGAYVLAARGDETVKKNNAMWVKFCKWLSIKKYADTEKVYQEMELPRRLEVRVRYPPKA